MMLRKLYNFIFEPKLRKSLRIPSFRNCSVVKETDIEISNETNVTAETERMFLKILNSSTAQRLNRYIDSSFAEVIVKYRRANGPYNYLNQVNSQIEYDILSKFYALVSDYVMEVQTWKKYMPTPNIRTIPIPEIIVGIHVGYDSISWTLMTSDYKILDLDYIKWSVKAKKLSTFELINQLGNAVQLLPSSNCYVLEDVRVGTKSLKRTENYQRLFTVAIMSCLKIIDKQRMRDKLLEGNSVYVLRPLTTAKLFNLLIDHEIIAATYITNQLLNNIEDDKRLYSIHIDNKVKQKFTTGNALYKENIGWSLLKALTFVRQLALFNIHNEHM